MENGHKSLEKSGKKFQDKSGNPASVWAGVQKHGEKAEALRSDSQLCIGGFMLQVSEPQGNFPTQML